jgi:hypothetical protein
MLTTKELLEEIQSEIGESSSAAMDLIGHLTSAESCECLEDLKANILEAKGVCLLILTQLNDELSRIAHIKGI